MVITFNKIFLFFSFCGTYLASQGCPPDQNLTIWRWEEEEMVAHKAAPASDHYQLAFSPYQHTKITSCGKAITLKFLFTRFFFTHAKILLFNKYFFTQQKFEKSIVDLVEVLWILYCENNKFLRHRIIFDSLA